MNMYLDRVYIFLGVLLNLRKHIVEKKMVKDILKIIFYNLLIFVVWNISELIKFELLLEKLSRG